MSIPYNPASDTTYPNISIGAEGGGQISYEQFVTRTVAPMGDLPSNLAHMALGVCGEAGELADAIKKSFAYKKELDIANVVEEMGDTEWYLAGMRQLLGIKRDDVLAANVAKLKLRYPDGEFSTAAATARADKIVDSSGTELPASNLHVIDMADPKQAAARDAAMDMHAVAVGIKPAISNDQVAAVDETAGINPVDQA